MSPGAGKRWQILYGRLVLVCDATVANRNLYADLTDGTNVTAKFGSSGNITASQTKGMSWHGIVSTDANTVRGDDFNVGINGNNIIEGSDQLKIAVAAGVAGDSFSGYFVVLETEAVAQ